MENQEPIQEVKPVLSVSRTIKDAVKENLISSGETVKLAIVESFTNEEIQKRVKATAAVIEKIEAAELELRKIKPTFSGYTLEGKPVGEPFFTKDQTETAKKTNEQLTKLNSALEKALVNNDFSKVFELTGKS